MVNHSNKGAFSAGCRKFQRSYTGPYKVIKPLSHTSYVIQEAKEPFKQLKTHFNRLKKCNLPAQTLQALDKAIEIAIKARAEADERNEEQHIDSDDEDITDEDDAYVIVNAAPREPQPQPVAQPIAQPIAQPEPIPPIRPPRTPAIPPRAPVTLRRSNRTRQGNLRLRQLGAISINQCRKLFN